MKQTHKKHVGQGGLHCPCCRKFGLHKAKIALNRVIRRSIRQQLKLLAELD